MDGALSSGRDERDRYDRRDRDRRGGGGGRRERDGDRRRRGRDDRRGDQGRHKRRRHEGGNHQSRGPRPPPPAPTPIGGAGSHRLVQLLTRVADVHARRTTDAEVPLQDNLKALSAAVAQKELGERPRVVAAQLALVAQASPLGCGAYASVAALLVQHDASAAPFFVEAAYDRFSTACAERSRSAASNALTYLCRLGAVGVAQLHDARGIDAILAKLDGALLATAMLRGGLPAAVVTPRLVALQSASNDLVRLALTHLRKGTTVSLGQVEAECDARAALPESVENFVAPSFAVDGAWPALQCEDPLLLSLVPDVVEAFRPGTRWDGIVVGSKSDVAKQLSAIGESCNVDSLKDVAAALIAYAAHDDAVVLNALHAILELCAIADAKFAPQFATAIELFFRSLDDEAAPSSSQQRRVALLFAHYLSNTKFVWPYWDYWASVVEEEDGDAQKRFVTEVLERCCRLAYLDRLKVALPEALHALLPVGLSETTFDDNTPESLAFRADFGELSRVVDPPEEGADRTMVAIKFATLDDDAARAKAAIAALCAHTSSLTHLLAPLDDAGLAIALRNCCYDDEPVERALFDGVVQSLGGSPQHVVLYMDAILRRGIARPSAFVRWLFQAAAPYGCTALASSFAPLELLEACIDRALDAVQAARVAIEAGAPGAEEAHTEALAEAQACCVAAAEGLEEGTGATAANARAALARTLALAAEGLLPPGRRSGAAKPLPEAAAFLED